MPTLQEAVDDFLAFGDASAELAAGQLFLLLEKF